MLFFSAVSIARNPTIRLLALMNSVLHRVSFGEVVLMFNKPVLAFPPLLTVQSFTYCLGSALGSTTNLLASSCSGPSFGASLDAGFSYFKVLTRLSKKCDSHTKLARSSGWPSMSLLMRVLVPLCSRYVRMCRVDSSILVAFFTC